MSNGAIQNEDQEGWLFLPIKDFAHTTSGGTPKRGIAEYYNGDIPWVKSGDLNNSYLNSCDEFITELGLKESSAKLFTPGTILIALYGATIGRLSILNFEAASNQAVCGITVPKDVEVKYLFYYLLSIRQKLIDQGKGGAQPNINQQIIKETIVPLAPKEQQKRIVAKIEELFSHIDAGIASLQAAKKLLKQYRQSVLKAAVTGELTKDWREANKDKLEPASQLRERILIERRQRWEEQQLEQFKVKGKKPKDDKWKGKYKEPKSPAMLAGLLNPVEWALVSIDQVAEIFLGKMLDKAKHTTGERLPYLRNINVRWGSINTDDLLEMFFKDSELKRYDLNQGDVLVCEGGEPGRAAVWGGSINMKYQKALHRIRFYLPLVPQYLVYLLEYFSTTGLLQRYFTGSTIKHLTKESLITFPFPLPPLLEMEQIVFELDEKSRSIRRLENEFDIQLAKAEKSKQAVLMSAFSGSLK